MMGERQPLVLVRSLGSVRSLVPVVTSANRVAHADDGAAALDDWLTKLRARQGDAAGPAARPACPEPADGGDGGDEGGLGFRRG